MDPYRCLCVRCKADLNIQKGDEITTGTGDFFFTTDISDGLNSLTYNMHVSFIHLFILCNHFILVKDMVHQGHTVNNMLLGWGKKRTETSV